MLIASMFFFMVNSALFVFGETHVEGRIVRDTVWTLTDSPFVVIRDVVIEENVTLTIESNVEVRFGGNFTLLVKGKLIANGTEEKPITFTSNKLQPSAGDWVGINFASMQSSLLEHCIVRYAKNGITIENGNLLITGSNITNNLQNGVYITGNNSAIIGENRIENNLNGIFVNGNSSGATIQRNRIYFNNEAGMHLYTAEFSQVENILISNNSLSTNPVGIHIYGQVNANITRNSIAYNGLGILYENATNIAPLYYNDLYGNTLGAKAISSDPVNAEHNYWGDVGGPYHMSLNPYGKGNSVESNGTDLDFIPFLTMNNSYINQRPIANLLTDKLRVAPNDDVIFIGTLSEDDGQVYRYFFNFGDEKNSSWTTLSIFKYKYDSIGSYNVILIVMDDFGVTSTNTAIITINVQNLNPLNVQLELGNYTVKYGERVPITVTVTDGPVPVDGASVTLISVKDGTFQPSSGLTDLTGNFASTFTVPNPSQMSNIRIIATASKDGYAEGSDYRYLRVLPQLLVEMTIGSPVIESNETTNIRVHATYNEENISDAHVQIQFIIDENISQTSGYTDADGFATFNFTAPQTLVSINVTMIAIVSKIGYAPGEAQTKITVNPKELNINVTTAPNTITSEETSAITILVTYNGTQVTDANVTILSDRMGEFDLDTKYTGEEGDATFIFTAPLVTEKTNITITAEVTKPGYAVRNGTATIVVERGTLEVTVVPSLYSIASEKTSNVTVYVICDGKPVSNSSVSMTATSGAFSETTGLTNSNGYCTFLFTAPRTTSETSTSILANATKLGYNSAENQATINVIPQTIETGGDQSLTTILLIVIPIVIVAIVVVLIKLRIIEISSGEEET